MENTRGKRIETKPIDEYIGDDINFIDFDKSLEEINKITDIEDLKELADKFNKLVKEIFKDEESNCTLICKCGKVYSYIPLRCNRCDQVFVDY